MENSALLQLGVGGIFAILVIKQVLEFLKSRNGKTDAPSRNYELLNSVARETRELYDWHKPDPRGEQTWKNSQMLEAVRDMTAVVLDMKIVVQNNTQAFEQLKDMLKTRE